MCREVQITQTGLRWGHAALPGAVVPLHPKVPFQQDPVLVSVSVAPYHPEPEEQACTWHALPGENHAKEKENSA